MQNKYKKHATGNSKCQKNANMQCQKNQKMPQINIWPSSESAGKKVINIHENQINSSYKNSPLYILTFLSAC